jgi:hypothetical protein
VKKAPAVVETPVIETVLTDTSTEF